MRKGLIKFQGKEFGPQKGASMTFRVKEELVNTSENEEVLYSRRNLAQTSFNNRGRVTQRGRTFPGGGGTFNVEVIVMFVGNCFGKP